MRKRQMIKQLGVLISENTYQELIKETDKLEIPISEFIRHLIEERLNSEGEESPNAK